MESIEIYYFSGTGNSLHVAKELQKRLSGSKLIPILSLLQQGCVRTNGDTVGFVFPHYASTLPKVVHTFIENLDLGSAKYLFAIVTRSGTKTMAFLEMDKVLQKKGRRLDSHFVFTMPSGSEPLVKSYADQITEDRVHRLESEMLSRLDSIQRTIVEQKTSREKDTGATPPPRLLVPFVPLIERITPLLVPLGKMVETSFEFYSDETCTGCGICEHVCLAEKVQVDQDRPVWRKVVKCHGCFACLNYCPEESIQVRSKWYLRSYTEQNGRYHHPEVTAGEIAAQKTMAAT